MESGDDRFMFLQKLSESFVLRLWQRSTKLNVHSLLKSLRNATWNLRQRNRGNRIELVRLDPFFN